MKGFIVNLRQEEIQPKFMLHAFFFYLIFIHQCTRFVVLLIIVLLLSFAIGSVIIMSHKSVIDGELPDIY